MRNILLWSFLVGSSSGLLAQAFVTEITGQAQIESAKTQANQTSKSILIEFCSTGIPQCQNVSVSVNKIAQNRQNEFIVLRVNLTEGKSEQELEKKRMYRNYRISYNFELPLLVVIAPQKNGKSSQPICLFGDTALIWLLANPNANQQRK